MALIDDIQAIDGYAEMESAEVVEALRLITDEVRDSRGWKTKDIIARWVSVFGAELGQAMAAKLSSSLSAMAAANVPFVQESIIALSQPTGLGLSADSDQAMINFIALQSQSLPEALRWDAEFVAAVKALGVRQVQRYSDVTEQEVIRELTIATMQAQITPLQSKLNAIATWLSTEAALMKTPAEYQAYADELLASDDGNPSGGE